MKDNLDLYFKVRKMFEVDILLPIQKMIEQDELYKHEKKPEMSLFIMKDFLVMNAMIKT